MRISDWSSDVCSSDLKLNVGGAFHSPLMEAAKVELQAAIESVQLSQPVCPIYQNVDAKAYTDPDAIKHNLIEQLTVHVRCTQTILHMIEGGANSLPEFGPGNVLQGLVKKVDRQAATASEMASASRRERVWQYV